MLKVLVEDKKKLTSLALIRFAMQPIKLICSPPKFVHVFCFHF